MDKRGQFYTAGAIALAILLLLHVLALPKVEYRPSESGRARAIEQILDSLTANALAYATSSAGNYSQYTSEAANFVSEALGRVDYRVLGGRVLQSGGWRRARGGWAKAEYAIEDNLHRVAVNLTVSVASSRVYFSNYTLEYLAIVRLYAEADDRPCWG